MNIQVEVWNKTDKRAGNAYSIETTVKYDPLRSYAEINILVTQQGCATKGTSYYTYETNDAPALSAVKICSILEASDQVWSGAVNVFHGRERAKQILDGRLERLLRYTQPSS